MSVENGQWVIKGVSYDDPRCIHSAKELADYVRKVGFLPLFGNTIPGFSVEEMTEGQYWWTGDRRDPWAWREELCKYDDIAYGKFFRRKAGFIAKEWFPAFANARRDGYDFDSRYDDGLASMHQKLIMDQFLEKPLIASPEMKVTGGFTSENVKHFDPTLLELEMLTYLMVNEFTRKRNKKGEEYGWSIAIYTTPEHRFGYDFVTSAYKEEPSVSRNRIYQNVRERYPGADEKALKFILQ